MFHARGFLRAACHVAVVLAVAFLTWLFDHPLREQTNAATVALAYLLLVLGASLALGLAPGVVASVASALCFNFFFLPPFGTFHIEAPQDWVAFGTFLSVAVVVSRLSAAVKARALLAEDQHERASKLYRLCRSVLATPDAETHLTSVAKLVSDIYATDYCSLHVPDDAGRWSHATLAAEGTDPARLGIPDLGARLQEGVLGPSSLESLVQERMLGVLYATISIGGRPMGVLALRGASIDKETADSIAGVVALALERVRLTTATHRA